MIFSFHLGVFWKSYGKGNYYYASIEIVLDGAKLSIFIVVSCKFTEELFHLASQFTMWIKLCIQRLHWLQYEHWQDINHRIYLYHHVPNNLMSGRVCSKLNFGLIKLSFFWDTVSQHLWIIIIFHTGATMVGYWDVWWYIWKCGDIIWFMIFFLLFLLYFKRSLEILP